MITSLVKAWTIAFFLCEAFGLRPVTTEEKDECVIALNSLKATMLEKFKKLEDDVKGISQCCGTIPDGK